MRAAELARRLAQDAEAVCRHYLPNGRRAGRYWLVGDTANTPGRSLFVRLTGPTSGPGAAGNWRDAATGEHGDLIDLIAASRRLSSLSSTLEEARAYLRLPRPEPTAAPPPAPIGSPEAARRLWEAGKPLSGTIAETYLRERGIALRCPGVPLRFHPRCFWQSDDGSRRETWPALLAKVTGADGELTGLHRTWLDPAGGKAPLDPPRRAMGQLLGNAVRFGRADDIAAAGEGVETVLSLQTAFPALPVLAALSAPHLAALELWPGLRRLYVALDNDDAGRWSGERLSTRARALGIEPVPLTPTLGDFNDDLRAFGAGELRVRLRPQLAPEDVNRLLQGA